MNNDNEHHQRITDFAPSTLFVLEQSLKLERVLHNCSILPHVHDHQ